jgi:hypothetical protein
VRAVRHAVPTISAPLGKPKLAVGSHYLETSDGRRWTALDILHLLVTGADISLIEKLLLTQLRA